MTDPVRRRAASIACEWWRDLNPEGGPRSGPRRMALARMRRAATPIEVMQEPEALRLIARLPWEDPDRVAMLAGILAHVRESDDRRVARAVGRKTLDDDRSALLSQRRLRRLLQTPDTGLMEPMRRLARMNKGRLNVLDLAFTVLRWGEGVKKRWILDYYGVTDIRSGDGTPGTPAPVQTERQESEE